MSTERKYFITDYETGFPYEVSKEVYDQYVAGQYRIWALTNKMLGVKSQPMVFGTGGDLHTDGLQELFTTAVRADPYKEDTPAYFIPQYDTHLDKFGQPKED